MNKPHYILILFFSIFILFFNIKVKAQNNFRPGYYITRQNDTIKGFIDYRGEIRNSRFCEYKKTENSETVRFEPSEIQAYRFINDKYYISKTINSLNEGKAVFVEFLVDGIINLYFYRDLNHYTYYIEDEEGKLYELSNALKTNNLDQTSNTTKNKFRHIGILKAILSDCKEIQNNINHVSLDHKPLINISREYHDYMCNHETCIIYEKEPEKIKCRVAPVIGGGIAKLHFNQGFFSDYNFESNGFPMLGVLFNFSFPKWNKKLSLDIEADIYQTKNKGSFTNVETYKTDYYNSNIDVISFQPSVALKYTFQKRKVKPTIAAGIYCNFFVSKDENQSTIRSVHSDAEYYFDLTKEIPLASNIFGVQFQLGCEYNLANNRVFFTNIRICQTTLKEAGISTFLNSADLRVGMYLGKTR